MEEYMLNKVPKWLILALLAALLLTSCGRQATQTPVKTQPATQVQPTATTAKEPTPTQAKTQPATQVQPTATIAQEPTPTQVSPPSGIQLPEVDPASLTGSIITAGSSTVYPLTERMAVRFKEEGFTGNITIDSIGTGAGFERFCVNGETDISNASRKIKDDERANCQAIGRNPIEFRVGTDALAVVVSVENDFVENLTAEQLALVFSTAEKWSDVDPSWPAEPILRFIPGTDSGTFDYFVEHVFKKDKAPILAASNLQLSEDDNVLVQGVAGSPYAIGFFGFAYLEANRDKIRPVSVDGVEPTEETAESGEYPLARPLFIYSDAKIMQEKPQVAAFINFYLTYVNEEILDVGYFPASEDALIQAKINWLNAMKK
jgi:phosphate transport system substrate-binding protein